MMEHGRSLKSKISACFLHTRRSIRSWKWQAAGVLFVLSAPPLAQAQQPISQPIDNALQIPDLGRVLPPAQDHAGVSTTLQIFVIMTVLTLAPSILIMTTCFARIMIVLALVRQALGVPQLPPSQILVGLSLFITFLVMAPTWTRIKTEAVDPYLSNQISQKQALENGGEHLRTFMFNQLEKTGNEEDVYLFLEYSRGQAVEADAEILQKDIPTTVLVPAFVLSELKTAFIMGFRIYLPFLVIDMVVASILISMGMMMLPPVLISLPFKLLLFVLADGWHLVVGSLMDSFG